MAVTREPRQIRNETKKIKIPFPPLCFRYIAIFWDVFTKIACYVNNKILFVILDTYANFAAGSQLFPNILYLNYAF